MINPEPTVVEVEGKPELVHGKDFLTLSEDNLEEMEKFLGTKIELVRKGVYGFPNDGKSRRTFPGDHLMFEGDKVIIWPPKQFKEKYDVKK